MLERNVKTCANCSYKPPDIFILVEVNGVRLNVFDIDLVIEVGKRIRAIAELKRYSKVRHYKYIEVPAYELIGYKKVAKSLYWPVYLIIFDGSLYYITEVDRFKNIKQRLISKVRRSLEFRKKTSGF